MLKTGSVFSLSQEVLGWPTQRLSAQLSHLLPQRENSGCLMFVNSGRILNSVLSLYGIVLQVFVIMAVHRLSRGKAIATILIPLAAGGALAGIVFLLIRK